MSTAEQREEERESRGQVVNLGLEPEVEPAREPVPFPLEMLPGAAADFVYRLSEGGLPVAFVGPAALAVLAGCCGGASLELGAGSWTEQAVLWVALIGEQGTGKSPSITELRRPPDVVQQKWMREHEAALAAWERLDEQERRETPRPIPRRLVVDDATMEALGMRLATAPAGLLLVADELRSLIRGLGQYKRTGGADRSKLLSLWSSTPLIVDRAKEPDRPLHVARPVLSVLGGLQPGLLDVLDGDDGLRERFLLSAVPDLLSEVPDFVDARREAAAWAELVEELIRRRAPGRLIRPTPEAAARLHAARRRLHRCGIDPDEPARSRAWLKKGFSHLARIALVLAVVDGAPALDLATVQRAEALLTYFLDQVRLLPSSDRNLLAGPQQRDTDRAVDALAAACRAEHDHSLTRRVIQQRHIGGARTGDEIDRLLARYRETFPGHATARPVAGGTTVTVWAPGHAPDGGAA